MFVREFHFLFPFCVCTASFLQRSAREVRQVDVTCTSCGDEFACHVDATGTSSDAQYRLSGKKTRIIVRDRMHHVATKIFRWARNRWHDRLAIMSIANTNGIKDCECTCGGLFECCCESVTVHSNCICGKFRFPSPLQRRMYRPEVERRMENPVKESIVEPSLQM